MRARRSAWCVVGLATLAAPPASAERPVPAPNLYSLLPAEARAADLARRHAAGGSFAELLERVSRGLVGAPYVLSPLGEGPGATPDPDPRLRFDAFDCTTLVETAMALAACDGPSGVAAALDQIRYRGGAPAYERRRHFVVGQWVEDLVAAGRLVDASAEVGGAATQVLDFRLDAARWKRRHLAKDLHLEEADVPLGHYRHPVVPLRVLLADPDRAPPGTVINVVRADVPWSPVLVTHQGLLLRRPDDGQLFVRHASPLARRVVDEPWRSFLERTARPRPWPVVGLSFYRVVDPGRSPAQ